jgi:hypothetical protein
MAVIHVPRDIYDQPLRFDTHTHTQAHTLRSWKCYIIINYNLVLNSRVRDAAKFIQKSIYHGH